MRIAVLSDTHLPRAGRVLPARLLAVLASADLIVHAGDLCTRDVLIEIEAYGPVAAVLGNNDEPALARLLPVERIVDAAGLRIGIVHDAGPSTGRGARLARRFPGCRLVAFGHSHQPFLEHHDGMLLLNPGSALERRAAPSCTMAIVEIADRVPSVELIPLS